MGGIISMDGGDTGTEEEQQVVLEGDSKELGESAAARSSIEVVETVERVVDEVVASKTVRMMEPVGGLEETVESGDKAREELEELMMLSKTVEDEEIILEELPTATWNCYKIVERPREEVEALMDKAFAIDDIREYILSLLMFEGPIIAEDVVRLRINTGAVQCLRQVSPEWMTSVTTICRKFREPLFKLSITPRNSFQNTRYTRKHGKLLERFLTCMTSSDLHDPERTPTFQVNVQAGCLLYENNSNLAECFKKCGSGLTDLSLHVPEDCDIYFETTEVTPYSFPRLERVTLNFFRMAGRPMFSGAAFAYPGVSGQNVFDFLNKILTGAECLKMLKLDDGTPLMTLSDLKQLSIPSTLETLNYNLNGSRAHFEALLTNPNHFSNLVTLVITVRHSWNASPLEENGVIYKILDRCKETLKDVQLSGIRETRGQAVAAERLEDNLILVNRVVSTKIPVKFPKMSKLQSIGIFSSHWSLNPSYKDGQLDNLVNFIMHQLPEPVFQEWTNTGEFASTESLDVALTKDDTSTPPAYLGASVENMTRLHKAFPHVTILDLSLNSQDTVTGLKYLFKEMTQLEVLTFREAGSHFRNCQWDCILLDPVPFSSCLVSDGVEVKPNQILRSTTSIKNLMNLKEFKLLTAHEVLLHRGVTLISDTVFLFGFLAMPKLKKLALSKPFWPSERMKSRWLMESDRNLDCRGGDQ